MADQHGVITGGELPNQGGLLGLYLKTGTTVAFAGCASSSLLRPCTPVTSSLPSSWRSCLWRLRPFP